MFYLVVAGAFGLAFAISFAREQRRLRNGVLLLVALLVLGLGLLFGYLDRPGADTTLAGGAVQIVVLVSLFLLLPLFLIANGVLMLRREGRRLGNLLSLLAGAGIVALTFLLLLTGTGALPAWLGRLVVAVAAVAAYLGLAFAAYLVASVVYLLLPRSPDVDFVVVHGSRLLGSAVPPLLAARLDRARRVLDAAESSPGERQPTVITSGGRGPDEEATEARAMADHLVAMGVPAERILLEEHSASTRENLSNSKAIMAERLPGYRCLMVTNDYHAFRTALLARGLGIDGHVLGARTAWYYAPSAAIREFAGILADHLLLNAVVAAALLVAVLVPS